MPEGSFTPYFLLVNISKNKFSSDPDFEKAWILKKQDFKKAFFKKTLKKYLKNETCMKFREESISDHPGGQK